jgi:hypothetical protein
MKHARSLATKKNYGSPQALSSQRMELGAARFDPEFSY